MIIVGVDGSVASRAAVEWAADDALRMKEPLRIVHVVDRSPYQVGRYSDIALPDVLQREGQRVLREAEALVHERQPSIEVATQEAEGAPAVVLREQAKDATEIVVGSRGLGGFAGALLGSVSTHVAGHAHCPVVVVRGEHRPVRGGGRGGRGRLAGVRARARLRLPAGEAARVRPAGPARVAAAGARLRP
ncbi:hypothetical protein GCM10020216_035490 [Nonomuraea helvata]